MVALNCSYLFGKPVHLDDIYDREKNTTLGLSASRCRSARLRDPSLPRGLQFDQADVTELLRPILGSAPCGPA